MGRRELQSTGGLTFCLLDGLREAAMPQDTIVTVEPDTNQDASLTKSYVVNIIDVAPEHQHGLETLFELLADGSGGNYALVEIDDLDRFSLWRLEFGKRYKPNRESGPAAEYDEASHGRASESAREVAKVERLNEEAAGRKLAAEREASRLRRRLLALGVGDGLRWWC